MAKIKVTFPAGRNTFSMTEVADLLGMSQGSRALLHILADTGGVPYEETGKSRLFTRAAVLALADALAKYRDDHPGAGYAKPRRGSYGRRPKPTAVPSA